MTLDDPSYRHILSRPADAPLTTHYELLGVAPGESDRAALEQAMLDCVVKVRRYQVGAYQEQALRLLNQLGEAYVCLTDDDLRRDYERSLGIAQPRGQREAQEVDAEMIVEAQVWPAKPEAISQPAAKSPSQSPESSQTPAAPACPQCGKPMSPRLTTCYHCNYRRSSASGKAGSESSSATPAYGMLNTSELLKQDASPEQVLARFNLMRDMYRAKILTRQHWVSTQPNRCARCNHKLADSNDAFAVSNTTLSHLREFVEQFARRQQNLGQQSYQWPLSKDAIAEVQQTIVRRRTQTVSLFCRGCAERMFKSPRV